jgi:hypothetical protein
MYLAACYLLPFLLNTRSAYRGQAQGIGRDRVGQHHAMWILAQQVVPQRFGAAPAEQQVGKLATIAPVPLHEGHHRRCRRVQRLIHLGAKVLLSLGSVQPGLPLLQESIGLVQRKSHAVASAHALEEQFRRTAHPHRVATGEAPDDSPPWMPNRSSVFVPMSQTATGALRSASERSHCPRSPSPQAK